MEIDLSKQEKSENRSRLDRRRYACLVVYALGLAIAAIFIHEVAHIAMALIRGVPFGALKIGFWGINPSVTLPPGLSESVKAPIFYAGGFTTGALLLLFYFFYWVRKYHRQAAVMRLWRSHGVTRLPRQPCGLPRKDNSNGYREIVHPYICHREAGETAKTLFHHREEGKTAKAFFRHREEGEARRGDLLRSGTSEITALTSFVRNDDSDGIETATPAPQARRDGKGDHRGNSESNLRRARLTWAMGLATIAVAAMEFANGFLEGRYHGAYLYGATTLLSPTHLLTIGWILSAVVLHLGFCPRKKLVSMAESYNLIL